MRAVNNDPVQLGRKKSIRNRLDTRILLELQAAGPSRESAETQVCCGIFAQLASVRLLRRRLRRIAFARSALYPTIIEPIPE
jgi:hypothetical protein